MYLSLFWLPLIAHYARIRVQSPAKLLKFEQKIAKMALKVCIVKVCVNRNIDLNYARSEPSNCISGTFIRPIFPFFDSTFSSKGKWRKRGWRIEADDWHLRRLFAGCKHNHIFAYVLLFQELEIRSYFQSWTTVGTNTRFSAHYYFTLLNIWRKTFLPQRTWLPSHS